MKYFHEMWSQLSKRWPALLMIRIHKSIDKNAFTCSDTTKLTTKYGLSFLKNQNQTKKYEMPSIILTWISFAQFPFLDTPLLLKTLFQPSPEVNFAISLSSLV